MRDDRTLSDDAETITFVHPITGRSYIAAQTLDGRSLSYELIDLANSYLAESWVPAREALDASPDNEAAQEQFANIDRELMDMIELMDDMRTLRSWVDVGR